MFRARFKFFPTSGNVGQTRPLLDSLEEVHYKSAQLFTTEFVNHYGLIIPINRLFFFAGQCSKNYEFRNVKGGTLQYRIEHLLRRPATREEFDELNELFEKYKDKFSEKEQDIFTNKKLRETPLTNKVLGAKHFVTEEDVCRIEYITMHRLITFKEEERLLWPGWHR